MKINIYCHSIKINSYIKMQGYVKLAPTIQLKWGSVPYNPLHLYILEWGNENGIQVLRFDRESWRWIIIN